MFGEMEAKMVNDTDYSGGPGHTGNTDSEPAYDPTDPAGIDPTTGNSAPDDGTTENTDPTKGIKKALLDTKRALTQAQMQNAELKGKLGVLESTVSARQQQEEADYLEELEKDEDISDKERKLIGALRKMRSEVGTVLKQRDDYWEQQITEARRGSNVELSKYQDQIRELRSEPEFDGWTDEQLLIVAKREASKHGDNSARSPIAGTSRRSGQSQKASPRDAMRNNPLFQEVYGKYMTPKEK